MKVCREGWKERGSEGGKQGQREGEREKKGGRKGLKPSESDLVVLFVWLVLCFTAMEFSIQARTPEDTYQGPPGTCCVNLGSAGSLSEFCSPTWAIEGCKPARSGCSPFVFSNTNPPKSGQGASLGSNHESSRAAAGERPGVSWAQLAPGLCPAWPQPPLLWA